MKRTFLIAVVLGITSFVGIATRSGIPPNRGDLVGVWIGYDESIVDFYRLNLRDDATGTLVILHPYEKAAVYNLHWEFSNARLLIQPPKNDVESISLSVTNIDYQHLEFLLTGNSNRWSRECPAFS
jgi:hypothetical protein